MKKPTNSQRCVIGSMSSAARSVSRNARVAGVGGDDVEPDHRREHDQPAGELVDQELGRGAAAAGAAEAADQEVGRDQRGLEDDVEEEHVGGGEDRQRHRLERERPGEEGVRLPLLPSSSDSCQPASSTIGTSSDGEQHHQQAEAVDAERVVDAERLDPGVGLGELHAAAERRTATARRCRDPGCAAPAKPRPTSRASAAGQEGRRRARRRAAAGSGRKIRSRHAGSPPAGPGRRAGRRRAGTGRRSGRSRSGHGAATLDRPPTAAEPPSTTPSTPTRSKVARPPTSSDLPGRTTTASLIASP